VDDSAAAEEFFVFTVLIITKSYIIIKKAKEF
jgi:hypothetical protein